MAKTRGVYPNVTVSLRDFYGTFMTSFPLSGILHSVKAGDVIVWRIIPDAVHS
jgi:hypothetical protein